MIGDVADPERLEVQGGRLAVDADVGHVATGPDELGAELEGGGHADRLDGHVGAEPVGERLHDRRRRPPGRC